MGLLTWVPAKVMYFLGAHWCGGSFRVSCYTQGFFPVPARNVRVPYSPPDIGGMKLKVAGRLCCVMTRRHVLKVRTYVVVLHRLSDVRMYVWVRAWCRCMAGGVTIGTGVALVT